MNQVSRKCGRSGYQVGTKDRKGLGEVLEEVCRLLDREMETRTSTQTFSLMFPILYSDRDLKRKYFSVCLRKWYGK